jgi:hypothetical protein
MNKSNLGILTHTSYFTNLLLHFLFISTITKHENINNMKFMNLNIPFDFIHFLLIKRRHSTKNKYFPKHILFLLFI